MDQIAERLENLSPEERRVRLAQLLRKKVKLAPLTFAQERLWRLDQSDSGNPLYNMPAAVRLSGRVDPIAFIQSLSQVVRRHETLRTTFAVREGCPVQVIAPAATVTLPIIDLQELPEPEREVLARRLVSEEAQRPFDLARGPLLRTSLLRLDASDHILILNMHHIISDAWSLGILTRETVMLYLAFSTSQSLPLAELPMQYADLACWQREWWQGEVLETRLAYWKRQLGSAPAILRLPTDRPRPTIPTFRGKRVYVTLAKTLSEALKALSQQEGSTLFVTLLAALVTLLYRYTGQRDMVIGTNLSGRDRAELETMIGFLVNRLLLRFHWGGDPTFRELLEQVRETTLEAQAHQAPYEIIVEALRSQQGIGQAPPVQVMFHLQNAPMPPVELPGLTLSQLTVDSGTSKFDLTLSLWDTEQGIRGPLEYDADLFDAATMVRMAGHLQTLLEGIVARPGQRLSDLPLSTEAEQNVNLVCGSRQSIIPSLAREVQE